MAKVAFVLADDFEDVEYRIPHQRMVEAGHEVVVIGLRKGSVGGKRGKETVQVQLTPQEVNPADFDAVVIPGGYSPDKLRMDRGIVHFVSEIARLGKTVAAVCHGPSLLIEADLVEGKRVTSWPSIHTDLVNAGAHWEDRPVVEDGNLVTSRNPDDLEPFSRTILERLAVMAPA